MWNRYGGTLVYRAHRDVFPYGLAAFGKEIGLPLIVHNRWIDPESPYRLQYQGVGLVLTDPDFWRDTANYLAAANVMTYEQDWLQVIDRYTPELRNTPELGDRFMDNMARAMKARGITLQYCSALPRHFLQTARYENFSHIRVSFDQLKRERWDNALYTSQLAGAVGAWPWFDVCHSPETDNLLLQNLSGGIVGIGDFLGKEDPANVARVCRKDGVLVKPDRPVVMHDRTFVADARHAANAAVPESPALAWTVTDHGPRRTVYVFAYRRKGGTDAVAFTPADFGLSGPSVIYDVFGKTRYLRQADELFTDTLGTLADGKEGKDGGEGRQGGRAFYIVAPVGESGIAFLGDPDRFVSTGRQRIALISETPGELMATVLFAAGEKELTVHGYSTRAVRAAARQGSASRVTWDPVTAHFELRVKPGGEPVALRGEPVRSATVVLTTGQ